MKFVDIEERLIDWSFQKYMEDLVDSADPIQTEKEDEYDDAIKLLSVGGVPMEMIAEKVNEACYAFARAGYHAGFRAAQKH